MLSLIQYPTAAAAWWWFLLGFVRLWLYLILQPSSRKKASLSSTRAIQYVHNTHTWMFNGEFFFCCEIHRVRTSEKKYINTNKKKYITIFLSVYFHPGSLFCSLYRKKENKCLPIVHKHQCEQHKIMKPSLIPVA